MAQAVITATANGKAIRIQTNMGDVPGLPCGDSTLIVNGINNFMGDEVQVVTSFDRHIELRVGEVDDIGGVTILTTTMEIRNALVLLLGW